MTTAHTAVLATSLLLCGLLAARAAPPRDAVLTHHNDTYRTGGYLTERTLTPASVATRGMAVSYWRPVDGGINGQPLYVPALNLGVRVVDAVFVTTTNGTVYAYDANERGASGTAQGLLWTTRLSAQDEPQTPGAPFGVLSTPVIDRATNTLFVVSRTAGNGGQYGLFVLDIRNGALVRQADVAGAANRAGVPFLAAYQGQRPAILLNRGLLYLGFAEWGGEGDHEYHGWILRFDAQSLQVTGAFNPSPTFHCSVGSDHACCDKLPCTHLPGVGAGVWQAGGGLAADDDGHVYGMTGNGIYDPAAASFGDSFLKLGATSTGWGLLQSYSPPDAQRLNECDLDLGSGGPLVIPGTDRLVGGGKDGRLFVLRRSDLQALQTLQAGVDIYNPSQDAICNWEGGPHLHGSPAYWRAANGAYVYVWAEQDYLRQFALTADGTLNPNPVHGEIAGPNCVINPAPPAGMMCPMPGGMLSISANDTTSGIVWATLPITNKGEKYYTAPGVPPPGSLFAYNAENLVLLWRADLPTDSTGQTSLLGKWTPPTVADGKVFVATSPPPGSLPGRAGRTSYNGRFLVYELGPLPASPPPVETALLLDNQRRLDVAWLDLSEGLGWHPPAAFSDVVAPAGGAVAMARQTPSVLAVLFFDNQQRLNVAWLDLTDGQGWHKPVPISDPVAPPGGHVAMAKQTDTVLTALFFDNQQRLNVAWLDLTDGQGWHKPVPISDSAGVAGGAVAMAKQTDTVLTALFFDKDGHLNVAWLDLTDGQGWHKPVAFSGVVAPPGGELVMAKQTDTVLTALFIGNDQKLNVAWLDLTDGQGWHKPVPISDPVAPPGGHVAMAKQTDMVLTALLVGNDQKLNVAWLDLTDGQGWHPPRPFSGLVAPAGAHVTMERQSP
jgi:hypothetical protein